MPIVSVIIPAYNGDRFIAEAIQSVLMQTFTDWDLVIVDDGSTDQTGAIARQYAAQYSNQIRYVTQENRGIAAARNRGVQETTGELVAFLDQDDVFLSTKLALQVAVLNERPHLGIVHSGWQTVDAQGQPIANVEPWNESLTLDVPQWLEWKPIFLGAMLFRRSLLESVGGFRTQWQQTDDVDLVLRMVRQGCQAMWVPQVTVQYRQHEANTSRKVHQQVAELEQVLVEFFQSIEGQTEFEKWEERSRFQSLVWSAWQLHRYGYIDDALYCLERSLDYTPFLKSETILTWIERYSIYSSECGISLDVNQIISSQLWKPLIQKALIG